MSIIRTYDSACKGRREMPRGHSDTICPCCWLFHSYIPTRPLTTSLPICLVDPYLTNHSINNFSLYMSTSVTNGSLLHCRHLSSMTAKVLSLKLTHRTVIYAWTVLRIIHPGGSVGLNHNVVISASCLLVGVFLPH